MKFLKGKFFPYDPSPSNFGATIEPVPLAVSATYFDSASALFDRLRELISAAQSSPEISQSAYLVQISFGVMLEASLYSKPVWDHYKSHSSTQPLIRSLLLDCSDPKLREGVVLLIRSICGSLPSYVYDCTRFSQCSDHQKQRNRNQHLRTRLLFLGEFCITNTRSCRARQGNRGVLQYCA